MPRRKQPAEPRGRAVHVGIPRAGYPEKLTAGDRLEVYTPPDASTGDVVLVAGPGRDWAVGLGVVLFRGYAKGAPSSRTVLITHGLRDAKVEIAPKLPGKAYSRAATPADTYGALHASRRRSRFGFLVRASGRMRATKGDNEARYQSLVMAALKESGYRPYERMALATGTPDIVVNLGPPPGGRRQRLVVIELKHQAPKSGFSTRQAADAAAQAYEYAAGIRHAGLSVAAGERLGASAGQLAGAEMRAIVVSSQTSQTHTARRLGVEIEDYWQFMHRLADKRLDRLPALQGL